MVHFDFEFAKTFAVQQIALPFGAQVFQIDAAVLDALFNGGLEFGLHGGLVVVGKGQVQGNAQFLWL